MNRRISSRTSRARVPATIPESTSVEGNDNAIPPPQSTSTSNGSTRTNSSSESNDMTLVRLPTPDFSKPLPDPPNRAFSLFSQHGRDFIHSIATKFQLDSIPERSQSPSPPTRTDTILARRYDAISTSSSVSSNSTLVSCDKFTTKWPRIRDTRAIRKKAGSLSLTEQLLEDGDSPGFQFDAVSQWTSFKWWLLFSVLTVFGYGCGCLVLALLTFSRALRHADIAYVVDLDILLLTMLGSCILLLAFVFGLTGTFLNSRPILAIYALLLWPALLSIAAVGYTSYKRQAFALEQKLDKSWSQYFTNLGRLLIQDSLHCCGYFSPEHEATYSSRCFSRVNLPGCKGKLLRYERTNLKFIWTLAFGLVPLHLVNITISLVCSNHVTRVFGMRIPPKQYWLNEDDVRLEALKVYGESKVQSEMPSKHWCSAPQMVRASSSAVSREDRQERRDQTLWNREKPGIL